MKTCVLVVGYDDDMLRRMSDWLTDAGYDEIMFCPGPGEPDYRCIGSSGAVCPLSRAADVVVVDLHLRSDEAMRGTPAWHLMLSYYEQGKKVVAIAGPEDAVHPRSDRRLRVIPRPPRREALIDAVGSLLADQDAVTEGVS